MRLQVRLPSPDATTSTTASGQLCSSGWWRANVSLSPEHSIQPMATNIKLTSCLRSLNEALQMICAVYSRLASRKLNSVAKLSEKHKLMTNGCILKSGIIDWICLPNSWIKCGMRQDSGMMNGVAKSTTVGGQLLLIGLLSRRWWASVNLLPKCGNEQMAGRWRLAAKTAHWADGRPTAGWHRVYAI